MENILATWPKLKLTWRRSTSPPLQATPVSVAPDGSRPRMPWTYTCHVNIVISGCEQSWVWSTELSPSGTLIEPSPAGKLNSPEDLLNFCEKEEGEMARWTCNLCYQFAHRSRQNVRNHVESRHYPNAFQYSCPSCDKVCYTMRAMEVHKSNVHRLSVWILTLGKSCLWQ